MLDLTTLDRTVGSSGISIGTHLALESLFGDQMLLYDEEREFEKININNYDTHVYNIFTLLRNLVNSFNNIADKSQIYQANGLYKLLSKEILLIAQHYNNKKCKPVLFYPDYDNVYKKYNANKNPVEHNMYKEHTLQREILKNISKKHNINSINNGNGPKLPYIKGKVLITTHIPYDLLSTNNIDLLESHTGRLRKRSSFNSKYHSVGQLDLSHLPYLEELLYILGDGIFIGITPLSIRRALIELSIKSKWTVRTTSVKVNHDLKRHPELKEVIKYFTK